MEMEMETNSESTTTATRGEAQAQAQARGCRAEVNHEAGQRREGFNRVSESHNNIKLAFEGVLGQPTRVVWFREREER